MSAVTATGSLRERIRIATRLLTVCGPAKSTSLREKPWYSYYVKRCQKLRVSDSAFCGDTHQTMGGTTVHRVATAALIVRHVQHQWFVNSKKCSVLVGLLSRLWGEVFWPVSWLELHCLGAADEVSGTARAPLQRVRKIRFGLTVFCEDVKGLWIGLREIALFI